MRPAFELSKGQPVLPKCSIIGEVLEILVAGPVEGMVEAGRAPGLHVYIFGRFDGPAFRLPPVGCHVLQSSVLRSESIRLKL